MTVAVAHSETPRGLAALRAAADEAVLRGQDLAVLHIIGGVDEVEVNDPAVEQPRCDAFEISPTGPLVGHRMTLPSGEPLKIEEQVFKSHGLTPGHFRQEGRDHAKGERRPLRVKPEDVQLAAGVDEHGPHITVAFTLPAGSYATVLLRELMKMPTLPELEANGRSGLAAASEK